MKCPRCGGEIPVSKICPRCGAKLSFGGNTEFYRKTAAGQLKIGDIFSDVFKKHPGGSAERALLSRQSEAGNMLAAWTKPFMFARLFAFLLVVVVLMGLFYDQMSSTLIVPLLFLGAGLVPLTIFLFIWEMDIPRGISIFEACGLILIGGVIALFIAGNLNDSSDAPAYIAGLTEEPTKLLISCLFMLAVQKKRRIYALDGLAIGAAVAAGFAFMETIFYSLNLASVYHSTWDILMRRSILSLCSHILFTAPFVGALGLAMSGGRLRGACFTDTRFLALFALGIGEHMLNNADIMEIAIIDTASVYIGIKHILIFITSWAALIYMFKLGTAEVMGISMSSASPAQPFRGAAARLVGVSGELNGQTLPLPKQPMTFGRDPASCAIVLKSAGVSRSHCVLTARNGALTLRDNGSSNGTFVNGARISPYTDVPLGPGDTFAVASAVSFRVM